MLRERADLLRAVEQAAADGDRRRLKGLAARAAAAGAQEQLQRAVQQLQERERRVLARLRHAAREGGHTEFSEALFAAQKLSDVAPVLRECQGAFDKRRFQVQADLREALDRKPKAEVVALIQQARLLGVGETELLEVERSLVGRDRGVAEGLRACAEAEAFDPAAFGALCVRAQSLGLERLVTAAQTALDMK